MPSKIDLTGMRFGRLIALREAPKAARHKAGTKWHCVCDCGAELVTETGALRSGHTKSCGCYHKDRVGEISTTHGRSWTPEWRAWRAMVSRCTVTTNSSYPWYGGRGITVCQRWRQFENFLMDMGPRPAGTTIDRINNDGNYEPGNCRWATREQQDSNKQATVLVTFGGETMTYSQWARKLGTAATVIRKRWLKYRTVLPIQRTKESYRAKAHRNAGR